MKHFLDFGTHYFYGTIHKNGLLSFEEQRYFGNQAPYDWHVQTFEPSKQAYKANLPHVPSIASRFQDFKAHNAAIAVFDGKIEFKWCPQNEAGSNCINEQVAEIGEHGAETYLVDAIDICRLISDIITQDKDAQITIKCDIEGSEFTVLSRLFEMDNVGQWMKQVFVEWHDRFWAGKESHTEILRTKKSIKEAASMAKVALYDWV